MNLHEELDFTTLNWVKQELDETLNQARQALEAFVEDPDDASQMRFCASYLHQVQGTLRMVELYGAALVIEEMERVAIDLIEKRIRQRDEAFDALLRGMVQLPDYLERLQGGHKDIPVVLLPLLNDLRATRGESLLTETVLFAPDLSVELPASASGARKPQAEAKIRKLAGKIRPRFQRALLAWFREGENRAVFGKLADLLDKLRQVCSDAEARRVWWVASALASELGEGRIEIGASLKMLFGRVDREIKRLADEGEQSFGNSPPHALTKSLLYYVAHAPEPSDAIREIIALYKLDALLPDPSELEHAKGSLAGRNRELLDTVSVGIKEDLLRVKDALDLRLRDVGGSDRGLAEQAEVLGRVADTLGMLGLGMPRKVVLEQQEILEGLAESDAAADEDTLLDVAGALLFVESSLDDHIQQLGGGDSDAPIEPGAELPPSEVRRILDALIKEASKNLQKIKQDVIEFIEAPWDHSKLRTAPPLLQEMAGAARMLDLTTAADLLDSVISYIGVELLQNKQVPSSDQLDTLADAIASIEYYFEAVRERRPHRDRILEVARASLAKLGYEPGSNFTRYALADDEEAASEAQSQTTVATARADAPADSARTEEVPSVETNDPASEATDPTPMPSQAAPSDEPPPDLPAADMAEDIDEEIRDIFIEEVEEELEKLDELFPQFRDNVEDFETLTTIRRSFHTLKGSGRLVGAVTIGEFSWEIENMLNRVLDQTIRVTPAIVTLLDQAIATLPNLLAFVRGEGQPTVDFLSIQRSAAALARGEDVSVEAKLDESDEAVFDRDLEDFVSRIDDEAAVVDTPPETEATSTSEDSESLEEWFEPEAAADVPVEPAVTDSLQEPEPSPDQGSAEPDFDFELASEGGEETTTDDEDWNIESISLESEDPSDEEDVSSTEQYESMTLEADTDDDFELEAVSIDDSSLDEDHGEEISGSAIDPVLLEILRTEVGAHLQTLSNFLDAGTDRSAAGEDLMHAVHTLNGAVSMVDLPELLSVTSPLEGYIKRLRVKGQAPSEEGIKALREAERAIRKIVESLGEDGTSDFEDVEGVSKALSALRDTLPEPSTGGSLLAMGLPEEAELAGEQDGEPEHGAIAPDRGALDLDLTSDDAEGRPADVEQGATDDEISAAEIQHPELLDETPEEPAAPEQISESSETESAKAPVAEAADPDARPEKVMPPAPVEEELVTLAELGDVDEELLEIFLQEGFEILDEADRSMQSWRSKPDDQAIVASLQRELHTLKGGARMCGVTPIGDLSHAMESLFEALAESSTERSDETMLVLETAFDRLHTMMERVSAREPFPRGRVAVAQLEKLLGQEPAAPLQETESVPATPTEEPQAQPESIAPPAPAPSRQQEFIRVRSDQLDLLVNNAGEVSIYRSRLEQQMGGMRFNLAELEQTVKRLREQLRKMEMETETQILSRFQREVEDMEDSFDPLELDRFSTLQQLSRAIGESTADLLSLQNLLEDSTREQETLLLQQSRVNADLQEGLMRTRMVPFESLVPRLRRILRQTSAELGKRARLRVEGAQGEMDRTVLERMTAPLEHMLRNALAHGLETPEQRKDAGKPEEGEIRIQVAREATEVVLRVSDDGAGIRPDSVRAKAIERGLLREDAELSERDLFGFILETGFSTADSVSKVAGRGVGMDVVNSEIKQLGGSLEIESEASKGTTFTIRLPFTLAVTQAIMIKIGDVLYAVPISSIEGVSRMPREEFERRMEENDLQFEYAEEVYTLQELSVLLGIERTPLPDESRVSLLIVRFGDQRAAIRVDDVLGSREVVVKSVGPQISSIPGIFGATILGDGQVVIILDLGPLIRRGAALQLAGAEAALDSDEAEPVAPEPVPTPKKEHTPLVMVVDDSITMRKVTSRVLQRHGMDVQTAKDGVDAVQQLVDTVPDLMLLDIEMPRMDGYEVATHMRNDDRLKDVPIIMITSRSGEKHRQRALEIGVDKYLGKPYQEAELLSNIGELLGVSID